MRLIRFGLLSSILPIVVIAADEVPNPPRASSNLVIDTFAGPGLNNLGAWHGPEEGMYAEYGHNYVDLMATEVEQIYNTQVSSSCRDMTPYVDMYLHVFFEGTDKFSLTMSQNNPGCTRDVRPFPATWDSVEAPRYAKGRHIYVPLSHFHIDLSKGLSIAFHGFYTKQRVRLRKVEITPNLPDGFHIPEKLPTGTLVLKCRRPNSLAFGIDDGRPQFAREVMDILDAERIHVTFFAVGEGLNDRYANFSGIYREMAGRGHQIALHSYSHPT